MSPFLEILDVSNVRPANPESGRNFSMKSAILSNSDDVDFRKSCPWCALAPKSRGLYGPFFAHHVSHVVNVCAEKQVAWFDAGRIVASVQDVHTVRYSAVGIDPRKTMSGAHLTQPAKLAIAIPAACRACPNQASALVAHRVKRQSVGKGHVAAHVFNSQFCVSHERGSFARVVRAGPRAATRTGPPFIAQNAGTRP